MVVHLLPCPSCARHVRASESACPFCSAPLEAALAGARAPRAPASRLGRAATFAFGAAVATSLGVTGCAQSEERTVDSGIPADAGLDAGGPVPAYGAPPFDAGPGSDSGQAADAGEATDAGEAADAGSEEVDAGGVGPLYGGPTPVDAGGGAVPAYGAPPES